MYRDVQWPLVIFSLLAGSGGALCAMAAVSELTGRAQKARFAAACCALALIVVGGLASMAHLASPQNAMAAAAHLGSLSGISVELIMLGVTFVVAAAYAIALKRQAGAGACKALGVVAGVCGLVLAFVCGHGYVIEARGLWNTNLLPFAYLCSVLPVGAFGYLACGVAAKEADDELLGLRGVVAGAGVLSIVAMAAYVVFVGLDVAGRSPVALYGGVIACGVIAVAVCCARLMRSADALHGKLAAIAACGCAAAVLGAVSIRVIMWVASDPFANLFGLAANVMFAG